jgi:hypothetical protein
LEIIGVRVKTQPVLTCNKVFTLTPIIRNWTDHPHRFRLPEWRGGKFWCLLEQLSRLVSLLLHATAFRATFLAYGKSVNPALSALEATPVVARRNGSNEVKHLLASLAQASKLTA